MSRPVFHYTTGSCARGIVESGVIRPATTHIESHERPVVWFSAAAFWEPTATKMIADEEGGPVRRATLSEMDRMAGGLFRFGVSADGLIQWPALARVAGIRGGVVRRLESVGRKHGALPSDWFGSLQPVLMSEILSVEQLHNNCWQSIDIKPLCLYGHGGA